MITKESWVYLDNVIYPITRKHIKKMNDGHSAYYEAWIDFEEFLQQNNNSRWWNYLRAYPNLAAHTAARMILKWDKWYASPAYVKMLDEMLKNSNIK